MKIPRETVPHTQQDELERRGWVRMGGQGGKKTV